MDQLIIVCLMKIPGVIFITVMSLVTLAINSFSQKTPDLDSLKIIEGIPDTSLNISILPYEALNGNFDILVEGFHYEENPKEHRRGYKICWPSAVISGNNVLYINHRQIYLRTEHDNPYPDFLYWIINISQEQYKIIEKAILKMVNTELTNKTADNYFYNTFIYNEAIEEEPIPYEWTYNEIIKHKEDYKKKLFLNFRDILKSFNEFLRSDDLQILVPTFKEFCKVKPIRTLYFREEYGDEFNNIEYKMKSK